MINSSPKVCTCMYCTYVRICVMVFVCVNLDIVEILKAVDEEVFTGWGQFKVQLNDPSSV